MFIVFIGVAGLSLMKFMPASKKSTCLIKGNISHNSGTKFYHLPGMEDYDSTVISPERGERWFCSESEATAQGWNKAGSPVIPVDKNYI